MAVEITVSETVEEFHRPERAVLSVQVSFDGPDKSGVRERTVTVADDIAAGLAGLLDAEHGPVTRYSRAGLATWADRPWNAQGQQLPPVHTPPTGSASPSPTSPCWPTGWIGTPRSRAWR